MDQGKVAVQNDHVVGSPDDRLQGSSPIVHGINRHPGLAKALGDALGKELMVLDHQYAHAPFCASRHDIGPTSRVALMSRSRAYN
jgi:hypothetical protein